MPLRQIALVSRLEPNPIEFTELARVAAALQTQVSRDFGPIWGVNATVDAPSDGKVPAGYWPIFIMDTQIDDGVLSGLHLDEQGQPFAVVHYDEKWHRTTSHECLEMLVDPWGCHLIPGPSPKQGQGQVRFLLEVCDPCEHVSYEINGVEVSDFYTPRYIEPATISAGPFSFSGNLTAPRTVLPGGYLSWVDPKKNKWWVQGWKEEDPGPIIRPLPLGASGDKSLRELVDAEMR
jgi:hypothetical protein